MSHKNLNVTKKINKILKEKLNNKKVSLLYKSFEKSLDINENFKRNQIKQRRDIY